MSSQRPDTRRRYQWLIYGFVVLLSVAGAILGVWLAATHPAKSAHHHHHGVLPAAVIAAVTAVAAAALMIFLIQRQNRRPAMQQLFSWDFAQRRAATRAVHKGEPLTADQRSIVQAQAEQLASATRRISWLLPIGIATFIVAAVIDAGGLRGLWVILVVIETVCFTALLLLHRIQLGRYRRALSRPSGYEGS